MKRYPTARVALVGVAAAIALVACSPDASTTSITSESTPPLPQVSAAPDATIGSAGPQVTVYDPADAPAALQFSAKTLDGKAFEGTSLYGQPTIIWFWAPWCPVCKAEAPAIRDALDELPDGVQAIGIPGQSDAAAMRRFVADYGLGAMVQVVDADGSLWSNFSVSYQPATVLLDADGNVTTLPGSVGKSGFLAAAASIAP